MQKNSTLGTPLAIKKESLKIYMSTTLSYDFKIVRFWIERNILFCQFLNTNLNHKLTDKDMGYFLKAVEDLTRGKRMPLLVDRKSVV